MAKPDFTLEFIKEQSRLLKLCETLIQTPVFALDIETVDWWNRLRERIALVQIAFRYEGRPKVAVIDALAGIDLEPLRHPLERTSVLKIIHNAAFDAIRLARHYDFQVAPIYDTMLAARRAKEKKYSLKAQAAMHLNLALDKSTRHSDWSRRPLDNRQLYYAALDSHSALLLYEHQTERNLSGEYRLKTIIDSSSQGVLPLDDSPSVEQVEPLLSLESAEEKATAETSSGLTETENELYAVSASILGIVCELPRRYGPDRLSVSLGADRVGLAGWIVDSRLGKETELDEETVKITISDLCERGLLRMTQTRRLEATEAGARIWRQLNK